MPLEYFATGAFKSWTPTTLDDAKSSLERLLIMASELDKSRKNADANIESVHRALRDAQLKPALQRNAKGLEGRMAPRINASLRQTQQRRAEERIRDHNRMKQQIDRESEAVKKAIIAARGYIQGHKTD